MPFRLFVGLLAIGVLAQAPQPSQDDWDSLSAHREEALERFMPIRELRGVGVAYRSYWDLYEDALERYFRIETPGGSGRSAATVVVPERISIQRQLLELHMRDPRASFDTIAPKI